MILPASLHLDGVVEIPIRESKLAKRPSLKMRKKTPYKVELVLPAGTTTDDIDDLLPFMRQHVEWILSQNGNAVTPRPFTNGMSVSIAGKKILLRHEPTRKIKPQIVGETLLVGGDIGYFHAKVIHFLKSQAKERAYDRIAYYTCKFGVAHKGIVKVSDMKTRWGTCNSFSHNITISWRLMLAPLYVFDHVIAHEVVHLRIAGHGSDFHKALAALDPHTKASKLWLAEHGQMLFQFEK